MDMWPACRNAVNEVMTFTAIVHDRFHVSKYLNEAVDIVRRQENRQMIRPGEVSLKGTRYWCLKNDPELTADAAVRFEALKKAGLKVAKSMGDEGTVSTLPGLLKREPARSFFF